MIMQRTAKAYVAPTREEIARRAYQIWEQEGQPKGHESAHWLKAEAELVAERKRAVERASSIGENQDLDEEQGWPYGGKRTAKRATC